MGVEVHLRTRQTNSTAFESDERCIQYPQKVKVVEDCLKFPGRVGIVKAKLQRLIEGRWDSILSIALALFCESEVKL
jgi:hypothetical protein